MELFNLITILVNICHQKTTELCIFCNFNQFWKCDFPIFQMFFVYSCDRWLSTISIGLRSVRMATTPSGMCVSKLRQNAKCTMKWNEMNSMPFLDIADATAFGLEATAIEIRIVCSGQTTKSYHWISHFYDRIVYMQILIHPHSCTHKYKCCVRCMCTM